MRSILGIICGWGSFAVLYSAKEGKTLMDLMDVYGLTNLIKVPTRIVVESSSLIDVILTNKPSSFLTSRVQECLILASVIQILFTLLCGYNVQNSVLEQL